MDEFKLRAGEALNKLNERKGKEVLLVHHDDADGLCSSSIMLETLRRNGFRVKTICLEKFFPEVLRNLHRGREASFIYCDLGSPHADLISKYNKGRNLVIILDHHDPVKVNDDSIFDLNLEHIGYKGEVDFSGSTCAYLFSETVSRENRDLSYLAVVGSKEIPVGIKGLNKQVLDLALSQGVLEERKGKFWVKKFGLTVDYLFSKLQVLGPVGYYRGGPELGIKSCLNGLNPEVKEKLREFESERRKANRELLEKIRGERLKETKHIQWFDSENFFEGMGSKVVGTFCSYLSYQRGVINPGKYIFGFMKLKREIPGYGELKKEYVKVSVRAPARLRKQIDDGRKPSAVQLLLYATKGYGVADGHRYAASCIIPWGMEADLIRRAEEKISGSIGKGGKEKQETLLSYF